MPKRSVTHATFVIERTYDASRSRVFAAWSDPDSKRKWFAGPPDWVDKGYSLDFRIGGREHSAVGPKGGPVHYYDATYLDIVPNERIIIAYDMHSDDTRISVSLATIELKPAGKGTKLTFTEQGAFLDGYDDAGSREHGTKVLLEALGAFLKA